VNSKEQTAGCKGQRPACYAFVHVRHIYEKAGVQARAGATLFALEHDLLP